MSLFDGHLTDAQAQRMVDGALLEPETASVERHVAECPECQAAVESYRMLAIALEDLEVPPLPADFTVGVLARIDAAERAAARERRWALGILAGVALATIVAFVAAGARAWAPSVSGVAERLGDVALAVRVGAGFLPALVGVFRLQIILVAAVVAIPLLVALARLMPAPEARAEVA
ncbi:MULTISPECIES: anti-sigma factor [Anaeromyxobacter]|uniref:anti-sigma factor family protein n=1 Tax=Anaeromyxobacter TaxID=161492 RepID=UPI001F55EA0A|nr:MULTISPECIES: zf-HC2 domain-containing protein [unclassified Anaeromyxobacter]